MIDFAYIGRKEWRGFLQGKTVAHIYGVDEFYYPQLKLEGSTVLGPATRSLLKAKCWVVSREACYG